MKTQTPDINSAQRELPAHFDKRRMLGLDALAKLSTQFANRPEFRRLVNTLLLTVSGQFTIASVFAILRKPDRSGAEPVYFAAGRYASNKLLESLILTPDAKSYFVEHSLPSLVSDLDMNSPCSRHFGILRESKVEVVCPIIQNDELLGLIGLGGRISGKGFDQDDLKFLAQLVSSVTPLIASSYQYWQTASLSEWYRELIDSVFQGVLVFGPDNKLKKINATALGIIGLHSKRIPDDESCLNAPIDEVFPADQFPDWSRKIVKAATEHSWRCIDDLKVGPEDNQQTFVAYVCRMLSSAKYQTDYIVTLEDVTERTRTREQLEEGQEILRATIESTADGILVVDGKGRVTHHNKRFVDMWRIPPELMKARDDDELLSYVLSQLVDPDKFLARVRDLYASSETTFDTLLFKDGRVFERFSSPLMRNADVSGRVWSFRDVTKRAQAEAALRESEERFRTLAASLPEVVFELDIEGRVTYVNNNAHRQFGYTKAEFAQGLMAADLIAEVDRQRAQGNFALIIQGKMLQRNEYMALRKDGSSFPMAVHSKPIFRDGAAIAVRGIMVDLTDRYTAERQKQELQAKLEKAERMESIGILAGGVAHDLNNMLGPVVGYPEVILRKLPDDHPVRKHVERIGASAQKAADVIQDLLTLARRGRYEMKPMNLNDLVREYLETPSFLEKQSDRPDVSVKIRLHENLSNIIGSEFHLTKALMNLVVNAFDAMPDGGELTIETSESHLNELISGFSKIESGKYVMIRVKDTGIGIDPEDLDRIFEPYYSKKKMGSSGSGLGLAIVYGIVRDHKGYYDIISGKGEGTEFIAYFPMTEDEVTVSDDSSADYRGNETILVIDDAAEQREIATVLLTGLGYDVTSVESGRKAIEYLSSHKVDIVLLDMIMEEDFDGLDTYTELIKIHPGQRAVIISGYSPTERVRNAQDLGAGGYVKKPFTRSVIGKAVREELDRVDTSDPSRRKLHEAGTGR